MLQGLEKENNSKERNNKKKIMTVNTELSNGCSNKDIHKNIGEYMYETCQTVQNNADDLYEGNKLKGSQILKREKNMSPQNRIKYGKIPYPSNNTVESRPLSSSQIGKEGHQRILTEGNYYSPQFNPMSGGKGDEIYSPTINNANGNNASQNSYYKDLAKQFDDIIAKMEISLKENVTNSKSKKYNIIKKGFEDIIKIMPVSNNTSNYIYNATLCQCLQKFLYGYHDVVSAFSHENKELKGKMDIYEKKLKEKNELISKKDKEISELKKLIEMSNNQNQEMIQEMNNANTLSEIESPQLDAKICFTEGNEMPSNSEDSQKNNPIFISKGTNEKMQKINQINLSDLDSLYFFDKVKMKPIISPAGIGIPVTKLDFEKLNGGDKPNNAFENNNKGNGQPIEKGKIYICNGNKSNINNFHIIKKKFK